jgi:hypothetical protein
MARNKVLDLLYQMSSATRPNNDVFMISSIKTRLEVLEIISISHSILDQFRDNWLET